MNTTRTSDHCSSACPSQRHRLERETYASRKDEQTRNEHCSAQWSLPKHQTSRGSSDLQSVSTQHLHQTTMLTSRPSTSASERSTGSHRSGSTSHSTTKSYREHEAAKEAKRNSNGPASASAAASISGSRPSSSQESKLRPTSVAGDPQPRNVERERSDSGFSSGSRPHSDTHTPDSPSLRRKRGSRDLSSIASLSLKGQADGSLEETTPAVERRSSTSSKRRSLPPRPRRDFGPAPTPPPAESGQRCEHGDQTARFER